MSRPTLAINTLRPKIDYCYHIWTGASQLSPSVFDRFEKWLHINITFKYFPLYDHFTTNDISNAYRYFITIFMENALTTYIS